MANIEQLVKAQYAKVYDASDWQLFKRTAEAQLREAAHLKKSDMRFEPKLKLLARNSRKRLLIGVGVELLLKAIYLKEGFCINKPKNSGAAVHFPFRSQQVMAAQLDGADTFTLNKLIDHLAAVVQFPDNHVVLQGLRIAKVFRNKEGHVVTPNHILDISNYRDIEAALVVIYEYAFCERLSVGFSITPKDHATWRILK